MILHGDEAKETLLAGIDLVANTVRPTLGPQARTAILQGNPPVVINDGVTIAKYVSHEDPYVQMGVQLIQNLASKAQSKAGDGTTTACIIAQELCHAILDEDVDNFHSFRLLFESARDRMIEALDSLSTEITDDSIQAIATIAANNDAKLGEIIAQVFDKVGRDGIITIEEGHGLITEFDFREGLMLDNGYISHLFSNQDNGDCVLEKPIVFVTNKELRNFKDILPALEYSTEQGRPLFIICRDLTGSALSNVLANVIQGRIDVGVIQAPNFGDAQLDELADIVAVVGGRIYSHEANDDLRIVNGDTFGSCDRVVMNQTDTTIIGGKGDVKERIASLRELYKVATNDWVKERVSTRISKLQGGVAVIKVGAGSAVEMRETKERLDDALNATKAALQEGVIVGGGLGLLKAFDLLEDKKGLNWLSRALLSPLEALMINGGLDINDDFDWEDIDWNNDIGYNATNNKIENLVKAEILDPVKVTKSSFSAAMSIALMFLTTEVSVLLPE
jgi:chaperonin GroEL